MDKAVDWHFSQTSQGRQSQTRVCATKSLPMILFPVDGAFPVGALFVGVPLAGGFASAEGSHFANAAASGTFSIYQVFRVASHRAPRRFASSFSANGTCKFVLMFPVGAVVCAGLVGNMPAQRKCPGRRQAFPEWAGLVVGRWSKGSSVAPSAREGGGWWGLVAAARGRKDPVSYFLSNAARRSRMLRSAEV